MNIQQVESILSATDAHLSLRILDFQQGLKSANDSQLSQLRVQKLLKTRKYQDIIKSIVQVSKQSEQNIKKHFESQIQHIDQETKQLETSCTPFIELLNQKYSDLEREKFSKVAFKQCPQFDFITNTDLQNVSQLAKRKYDEGKYQESLRLLSAIQNLVDESQSLPIVKGKLHCYLMLNNISEAKEELKKLKAGIATQTLDSFQQFKQVTQIANLHLFTVFDEDQDSFIQLFQDSLFEQCLVTNGHYLMKYLISAMLLNKNFNFQFITDMIERNLVQCDDNITKLIKSLFLEYDFKQSQKQISKIQEELKQDFFLHNQANQIAENAQHLIFQVYFKMQKIIKIDKIADFLEINKEEAEINIVNFMSQFNIKAKIDSVKGEILILRSHEVPFFNQVFYEDVQSKIRDLLPRTTLLANNLQRIIKAQNN